VLTTFWTQNIQAGEENGGSELELKNVLGNASNAERRGQPNKLTLKDGVPHAEVINQRKLTGTLQPRPDISGCWCARYCREY